MGGTFSRSTHTLRRSKRKSSALRGGVEPDLKRHTGWHDTQEKSQEFYAVVMSRDQTFQARVMGSQSRLLRDVHNQLDDTVEPLVKTPLSAEELNVVAAYLNDTDYQHLLPRSVVRMMELYTHATFLMFDDKTFELDLVHRVVGSMVEHFAHMDAASRAFWSRKTQRIAAKLNFDFSNMRDDLKLALAYVAQQCPEMWVHFPYFIPSFQYVVLDGTERGGKMYKVNASDQLAVCEPLRLENIIEMFDKNTFAYTAKDSGETHLYFHINNNTFDFGKSRSQTVKFSPCGNHAFVAIKRAIAASYEELQVLHVTFDVFATKSIKRLVASPNSQKMSLTNVCLDVILDNVAIMVCIAMLNMSSVCICDFESMQYTCLASLVYFHSNIVASSSRVVWNTERNLCVWNCKDQTLIALDHSARLNVCAITPNGRYALVSVHLHSETLLQRVDLEASLQSPNKMAIKSKLVALRKPKILLCTDRDVWITYRHEECNWLMRANLDTLQMTDMLNFKDFRLRQLAPPVLHRLDTQAVLSWSDETRLPLTVAQHAGGLDQHAPDHDDEYGLQESSGDQQDESHNRYVSQHAGGLDQHAPDHDDEYGLQESSGDQQDESHNKYVSQQETSGGGSKYD